LAIDEIETSLHDDLLDFFIFTFINNSAQSQLLFTTHNQSLLDSELLSNDEIWFVQKDKTGGSEFFSLKEHYPKYGFTIKIRKPPHGNPGPQFAVRHVPLFPQVRKYRMIPVTSLAGPAHPFLLRLRVVQH
jgi:hypothetical protein